MILDPTAGRSWFWCSAQNLQWRTHGADRRWRNNAAHPLVWRFAPLAALLALADIESASRSRLSIGTPRQPLGRAQLSGPR